MTTRLHALAAAAAIAMGLAMAGAAARDITTHRVRFEAGGNSAQVAGRVEGYGTQDYVLGARAGQRMTVTLSGPSIVYFNVLPPGSEDEAIFIGSSQGDRFSGRLPASGDYTIRVYQMRATARRGEAGSFRLDIAVTGAGDTASGERERTPGATGFPAALRVIGAGYPAAGAPCRRLGESAATSGWLDHTADLVGCPSALDARRLGGRVVGTVEGITVVSVPRTPGQDGARPPQPAAANATAALERRCRERVESMGTRVRGIRSVETTGPTVTIDVDVQGGAAPWRCIVGRDGAVREAFYTGDEGRL